MSARPASPYRIPQWLQWTLAGVCLVLLARVMLSHPAALRAGMERLSFGRVAGSALLLLIGHYAAHALIWYLIGRRVGARVPLRVAVRVWSDSLLGRYLPGAIWGLAARLEGYRNAGEPAARTTLALLIERIVTLGSCGFLSLLVLARLDPGPPVLAALAACLALGAVLLSRPRIVHWLVERIAHRLGKTPPEHGEPRHLWDLWVLSVLAYTLSGLGFFWFMNGLVAVPWHAFPYTVGALYFAGLVGMAAVIVPTGLGVREGALAWLLLPLMPAHLAALVSVLSRPWILVAELVWLLAARLLTRFSRRD